MWQRFSLNFFFLSLSLSVSIFDQREMDMSFTKARFTITAGISVDSLSDTISHRNKSKVRYTDTRARATMRDACHLHFSVIIHFIQPDCSERAFAECGHQRRPLPVHNETQLRRFERRWQWDLGHLHDSPFIAHECCEGACEPEHSLPSCTLLNSISPILVLIIIFAVGSENVDDTIRMEYQHQS